MDLNYQKTYLKRNDAIVLSIISCISFNRCLFSVFSWYISLLEFMGLYCNGGYVLISPRDPGFQGQEPCWQMVGIVDIVQAFEPERLRVYSLPLPPLLLELYGSGNHLTSLTFFPSGRSNKDDNNFLLRPPSQSQRTCTGHSPRTIATYHLPLDFTSPGHSCTRSTQLTPILRGPVSLPEPWNLDPEAESVKVRN